MSVVYEMQLAGSKTRLIHEYLKTTTGTANVLLVCMGL
jgi:hypothetical protein